MADAQVRPRTRLGHYTRLLNPNALAATRLLLDRDVRMRARRVAATLHAVRRPGHPRMRGLIASPGGTLAWRSVTRPALPGPRGALVRPIAVATCDVDRATMLGRSNFPLPLHLGHESVAEVVEVGPEVDRRVSAIGWWCLFKSAAGTVRHADAGTQPIACRYRRPRCTGSASRGAYGEGALADLMAVPFADAMLVPLPDGVDPAAAAGVADNISDCYRQVAPYLPSLLATDPDAETLIVGRLNSRHPFTSSAMLFTALIARALGGRRISVVDGRPAPRERAEALGFTTLDPRRTRDWPIAPLTIDATGTPAGLRAVLKHTAPDGICSCVWSLHRRGAIPLAAAYIRNVTLHIGRAHIRALILDVLDLMVSGRLQPEVATTNVASFNDAPAALLEHCHGDALKTILIAD